MKAPVGYKRNLARKVCALMSRAEQSIQSILKENPDLPSTTTLQLWRERYPLFATMWQRARELQADHLMQKTLDLASAVASKDKATKLNAHDARVMFDIYRHWASKAHPTAYGDKPSETNLSVNTFVVPQDRLREISGNLDRARTKFKDHFIRKSLPMPSKQKLLPPSQVLVVPSQRLPSPKQPNQQLDHGYAQGLPPPIQGLPLPNQANHLAIRGLSSPHQGPPSPRQRLSSLPQGLLSPPQGLPPLHTLIAHMNGAKNADN